MHTLNKLDGNPSLIYIKMNNISCHINHIVTKICYVSSVQYKIWIPDKCWMCTIEMLNVHNTNLEYIQYKNVEYVSISCDDVKYICISLSISMTMQDHQNWASLMQFVACNVSTKEKLKYTIKYLIYK